MLANIDVLVAIWDGQLAAGTGGTAQIVSRAIDDGILVVWMEPNRPDAVQISRPVTNDAVSSDAKTLQRAFHAVDATGGAQAFVKQLRAVETDPAQDTRW